MENEIVPISPEGLEIANCYLQYGNVAAVSDYMNIPRHTVVETLATREVKKYIDTVYLDLGFRNRDNIASVMDEMINEKLEQARETGMYSNKDLADLMMMQHKMRMDEIAAMQKSEEKAAQTNIQINNETPFGAGNYGKLMEKLLTSNG